MMYWGNGWGYLMMGLGMIVFWGLLIAGIVVLVRSFGGASRPSTPSPGPNPQQLLAERFARGEIDEREYRDRLAMLQGIGQPINR
jgi:putative membrane protein